MKTMFFEYGRFGISWFMFFVLSLGAIGYYIARSLGAQYGEDKKQIEDIYLMILLSSFMGARIFYVITHFSLYKGSYFSILKLSHDNLSLIGGVITGLIVTFIVSKKEKIEMNKLLKIMLPPFYFSIAVGIWIGNFDPLFNLSSNLRNNPRMVLLVSIIFLGGLILELTILKEEKRKNLRWLVLIIVMFLYYII